MYRIRLAPLLFALLFAPVFLRAAWPSNCSEFASSGSVYLICYPSNATQTTDLVVYAHGYVAPNEPVGIPEDQLVLNGVSVPALVTQLGFVFATTSYPRNGLAIKEGVEDVKALLKFYKTSGEISAPPTPRSPTRVYLAGVSEGALVTAKAIEDPASGFSGGLALCGPIGDFRKQINYFGDFRVLFDYFFPDINIPNSAVDINPSVLGAWTTTYVPQIVGAVASRPLATGQLLKTGGVSADPAKIPEAVEDLLWYNVFATNDAGDQLGGQPFDNKTRWYSGSLNDLRLNWRVDRFRAEDAALKEMQANYQTSGKLPVPMVTMHTTGDHVVPYWHANLYGLKVLFSGSARNYIHLPVFRYGHCSFTPAEVLLGFGLLVGKVNAQ